MYLTLVLGLISAACVVLFVVSRIFGGNNHGLAGKAFWIAVACYLLGLGTLYLHRRAEQQLGEHYHDVSRDRGDERPGPAERWW
jgi:hypothetical protein